MDNIIIGNEYKGKFALLLDKYQNNEIFNHYSSLGSISNKNGLNNNSLNDIKNRIINK